MNKHTKRSSPPFQLLSADTHKRTDNDCWDLVLKQKVLTSVGDPWHFGAAPDPDPDPYLWLMDPDPDPTSDPTSFFIDFKDAKQNIFFHIFFL